MISKAYSAKNVNEVKVDLLGRDRDGQELWVGVDVGKVQMQVVLNWGPGEFERPWKVDNPRQIGALLERLRALACKWKMRVAMEPSGTYGDGLRQACAQAGIEVQRVHPKIAHDYAEVFDGVPSQHDGKDAAVVAELCRCGKSRTWTWSTPDETAQQIDYWVDRMDVYRRLRQVWGGRLEARLARHWPEVLGQLKLTSATLLRALIEYGGPTALAADEQAAVKLKRWGKRGLTAEAVKRIIEGAQKSMGVKQHAMDQVRLRDYAQAALEARQEVREAQKRLVALSRGHKSIGGMAQAVGVATACVLWSCLGDPSQYHCAAAFVKAMGLNLKERSSGLYKGKLKISKRGNGMVRYWMYLAALRLCRQESIRPWYLRKKQKDGQQAKRALVGIMRKLGLAVYYGGLGEAFDAARLFPGPQGTKEKGG